VGLALAPVSLCPLFAQGGRGDGLYTCLRAPGPRSHPIMHATAQMRIAQLTSHSCRGSITSQTSTHPKPRSPEQLKALRPATVSLCCTLQEVFRRKIKSIQSPEIHRHLPESHKGITVLYLGKSIGNRLVCPTRVDMGVSSPCVTR